MRTRSWFLAIGLFGCGGTSTVLSGDDLGVTGDAGGGDLAKSGGDGGAVDLAMATGECGKPENMTRLSQLLSGQPAIDVRSKKAITLELSFASVAGNATVMCPYQLKFKDSNGSGTLDPYEDWRLAAADRAKDLLGRLSADQKAALLAHPVLADSPASSTTPSMATQAAIAAGVRFGLTGANTSSVTSRATWANNLQEACEATPLGVPFALSSEPAHASGNGRTRARGFSAWPSELGLAAAGKASSVEAFAKVAAQELRAIGVRILLGVPANLYTDPRSFGGQFTLGEDSAQVADRAAAFIKGLQGGALGATSVAGVLAHYPGLGPVTSGLDGRLQKGKYLVYPGNNIDAHLSAFQKAIDGGAAGVILAYGIPRTGPWSGLGGTLDGKTIEQVGAPFNKAVVTDALRGKGGFKSLVIAPLGAIEDPGVSPLGAPWGVENLSRAQRLGKAVNAGVDQFAGLADGSAVTAARGAALITDPQIDAAAGRALALLFQLGLFEAPYVDAAKAAALCNTDDSYHAGLVAQDQAMVLLVNAPKPGGWLNGMGDGSQMGDKGNAGNGSRHVLPAPPGEPYVAAGCSYFIAGSFDLDYVRSVSTGYGNLTNDALDINGQKVMTAADRMAASDYIFIRIDAPCSTDPDSGPLASCKPSLEYATNDNKAQLDAVAQARAAIDAHPGSKAQIVVAVDGGRAPVLSEILAYKPSGLFLEWGVSDKVFLDVAFGIVDGVGALPVGVPLSNSAAASQKEDLAGDGQDATFVKGFGLSTKAF